MEELDAAARRALAGQQAARGEAQQGLGGCVRSGRGLVRLPFPLDPASTAEELDQVAAAAEVGGRGVGGQQQDLGHGCPQGQESR